jgi:hypothetical protein
MDPDGSDQTQLTSNDDFDDSNPTWSPDGTQIVFASNRDTDFEIFVMDADGSDQTQLTSNSADDTRPNWQPLQEPVGGKLLSIDTTALILAGVQATASWLVPVVVSSLGIGMIILHSRYKKSPKIKGTNYE